MAFLSSSTSRSGMGTVLLAAFRIAVDNLILKADGTYYPLEAELLEDSPEGALRFVELFSNDGEDETSNRGDENGPRFKVRQSSR